MEEGTAPGAPMPDPDAPSRFSRFRQEASSRAFAGTFSGLARVGRLAPQARPRRHGLRVLRNLAYQPGGNAAWTLDLYEPLDLEGSAPVVLYIHGGGFRALSKDTHWLMGLAFARQGWRVVNINYRLAPRDPFPAAAQDVCAAWTWLVEHAEAYGFDLDRVVFAGESAGANLATMLTLSTLYERPEPWARAAYAHGVVPRVALPACGILQVAEPERYFSDRTPGMVKDAIVNCCHSYVAPHAQGPHAALASPLTLFEQAEAPSRPVPGVFAPAGGADPLKVDSTRLAETMRRIGGEAEAPVYSGELHAFHAFLWRENARACWRDMLAFTAARLD